MQNQHTFKLIDGTFSTIESRQILQSVFTSKLQFHQLNNFSSRERFGRDDETAKIRIRQLSNSLNELLEILAKAENNGEQIRIKSDVEITVIEKEVKVVSI